MTVVEDEMLSYLISWLPLVLILVVWVFITRRSFGTNARIMAMNEEILTLNREMADSLRNIEKLLGAGRGTDAVR